MMPGRPERLQLFRGLLCFYISLVAWNLAHFTSVCPVLLQFYIAGLLKLHIFAVREKSSCVSIGKMVTGDR